MSNPFPDLPSLCGPLRRPRQMLAEQQYDGHRSIHDDDVAEKLGLRAGPIEGPTHFSQFAPLLYQIYGQAWFETGCISVHYQTMVVEGEEVRAFVQPAEPGRQLARVWVEKRDGTPVLTGTASVGPRVDGGEPTEIEQRIAKLRPPTQLVIHRDLRVGQKGVVVERVRMGRDQHMGDSYPFTLADKLMYERYLSELSFIIYENDRYTFAEAWRAASRIGYLLVHECGVCVGDRVAIAMRNYPEWMLAFTAITSIGAVAVAVNAHWQPDEIVHGLVDSGAKVLFTDQERLDRLVPSARSGPVPGLRVFAVRAARLPDGVRALTDAVTALGDVAMPAVPVAPDDLATILYTSGSSWRAKGVPSTHRNIVTALMSWQLDTRISERVAGVVPPPAAGQLGTLLAVPLFHVTGLHASFLASYALQRRIVCMYRWDPEVAARLIECERLTSIVVPAAITGDLVRVAKAGRHDLSTLLAVGGGGAPRAPEQVRQIDASFPNALPNIGWA